jgi:hypothetical protein
MDRFWLTDAQFAKIARHLQAETRGRQRVHDRRVISGIVHVLKCGGPWPMHRRSSTIRRRRSTIRSCAGPQRAMDHSVRGLATAVGRPPKCCSTARLSDRALARRAHDQDPRAHRRRVCRPIAFVLIGGQVADCTAGVQLCGGKIASARGRARSPGDRRRPNRRNLNSSSTR